MSALEGLMWICDTGILFIDMRGLFVGQRGHFVDLEGPRAGLRRHSYSTYKSGGTFEAVEGRLKRVLNT